MIKFKLFMARYYWLTINSNSVNVLPRIPHYIKTQPTEPQQNIHISVKCFKTAVTLNAVDDGGPQISLVNKANLVHNFSQYVYFFSVNVSGNYIPIIRRNNCIYATLSICHSVLVTLWYAEWIEIHPAYQTVIHTE